MLHIYASVNTGFGSDNGLSPTRRQAFIWTNAGFLPIGPQGTNFTEILIKNEQTFHSRKGIWTDRLWNGGHLVHRADELPTCGAASECHAWLDSTSSGGISSTCLWGLGDLYVKQLVVHRAQKSVPDSAGEWPTFLPPPLESCSGTANVDVNPVWTQDLQFEELWLKTFDWQRFNGINMYVAKTYTRGTFYVAIHALNRKIQAQTVSESRLLVAIFRCPA